MFEVCEIARLVNADPAVRKAAVTIQGLLLDYSRSQGNLLEHEKPSVLKKKKDLPPLLPRFDVL